MDTAVTEKEEEEKTEKYQDLARGWENVEGLSKGITSGDGGIGDSPKKAGELS